MPETIKDKLRRLEDPDRPQGTGEYWNACGEALDEIERLERHLNSWKEALDKAVSVVEQSAYVDGHAKSWMVDDINNLRPGAENVT